MKRERQKKITIIGAGFTGLSAAYYLSKKGYHVEVFESAPFIGGQASTIRLSDFDIERGYHHLFTGDSDIIELIEQLDLKRTLKWYKSSVGIFDGENLFSFQTALDLIRFNSIPLIDRLRLGLVTIYLRFKKNWESLEMITASDWIKSKAGIKVFDQIWGPLLRGKFGEYSNDIGMPWFWGKIQTRFASRKGFNKEVLGYPVGSFKKILDKLREEINRYGGKIYISSRITKIKIKNNQVYELEYVDQNLLMKKTETTIVLSTVPSFEMNKLCQFPQEYSLKLESSRYLGASVFILELKKQLTPFYWLNITDKNSPFLGVIEQSNLLGADYYKGKHLVYVTNYLDRNDWRYKSEESELLSYYCKYLTKINKEFTREWILNYKYNKISAAQPIIGVNYREVIPSFKTPVKGLFLANTTQIYPEDRGTNYSVKMAKTIIKLIENHIREE